MIRNALFAAVALAAALLSGRAGASCSRPIVVPASSLGKMMTVNQASGDVGGVYPELLRERGRRAGCEFVFPVVPRARAEAMLRQGDADLLVGAVQVPERDQWGRYIPMIGTEWMLISTDPDPPRSTEALLARPGIRLNVVRSYNYGPAYLALLARLDKQGKLEYVKDPQTIARKMEIGRADYAYMPSNTFAGTLEELGLRDSLGQRVHYTRLAGIPASTSGVYISRKTAPDDAAQLAAMLEHLRRDGELLARTRKLFTPAEMSSSFPLPRSR
ncbi:hypothetical protein ASD15_18785 [Massilia sp. Root351]|jgi:polar amino acid transport system substrate-binding protein|uniref:substrate-binding periplasmic protein n=1 Tax=Massilia sp. Root351 TaxID=1736522 RepID=UPI00070DBE34|nr:transporter substrate-binding domain-containing protein [Massilia sp. Root351]KQV79379.1 hypothetical protein ASD15_18785 [Massilia sp. Root351]